MNNCSTYLVFTFGTTQNTTKTVQYEIVKKQIDRFVCVWGGAVSTNNETWKACNGMVWSGVKAVDAYRYPIRQNRKTCLCTVSRPTTNLNLTPPP